jgi:hypothetical protein
VKQSGALFYKVSFSAVPITKKRGTFFQRDKANYFINCKRRGGGGREKKIVSVTQLTHTNVQKRDNICQFHFVKLFFFSSRQKPQKKRHIAFRKVGEKEIFNVFPFEKQPFSPPEIALHIQISFYFYGNEGWKQGRLKYREGRH